jgi:MoaA/NifB/PqqE/SkfB family radical SAM enzyme
LPATILISCPKFSSGARSLGADALHTFLLVPVGCGVDIAAEQMVRPEEYERMLNWFYDQSLIGGIELKATCAPHYFVGHGNAGLQTGGPPRNLPGSTPREPI